jgi:putative DNA primase/helicase
MNTGLSTEPNLQTIIEALGARRSGSGWAARCPAHKDHNPSLSVTFRDGKILLHCHAGCSQGDVIAALRDGGLLRDSEQQTARVITATYDYTDEAGNLLYQIVRQEPKAFLQRRPDGAGGWIWRKGDRQVLYRLPEVLEAPIVFVVEGEKDVETLRGNGFVATTNSGGAKARWLDSYTETLRGRECILVPDNDRVGWERAAKIAKALLGTAARIRILDMPRDYKDISDWFGAGHSECELITMLEGAHAV